MAKILLTVMFAGGDTVSFVKGPPMTVIAALFDSEADATPAMDRLLNSHLDPIETRVMDPKSNDTGQVTGPVVPLIPNTSAGYVGAGVGTNVGGVFFPSAGDWLHDLDEVEQKFYSDAYREGSTLVLAKVDEKDAQLVRDLFRQNGARTYTKE